LSRDHKNLVSFGLTTLKITRTEATLKRDPLLGITTGLWQL